MSEVLSWDTAQPISAEQMAAAGFGVPEIEPILAHRLETFNQRIAFMRYPEGVVAGHVTQERAATEALAQNTGNIAVGLFPTTSLQSALTVLRRPTRLNDENPSTTTIDIDPRFRAVTVTSLQSISDTVRLGIDIYDTAYSPHETIERSFTSARAIVHGPDDDTILQLTCYDPRVCRLPSSLRDSRVASTAAVREELSDILGIDARAPIDRRATMANIIGAFQSPDFNLLDLIVFGNPRSS